jgi:hypothetical protein
MRTTAGETLAATVAAASCNSSINDTLASKK